MQDDKIRLDWFMEFMLSTTPQEVSPCDVNGACHSIDGTDTTSTASRFLVGRRHMVLSNSSRYFV